jgi:hypothetical protein
VKPRPREKALILGPSWQPGGACRGSPKGKPEWASPGVRHQDSPKDRGLLSSPGWEYLEVVLVVLETSPLLLLALNIGESTKQNPCSTLSRCSQILDFASKEVAEKRTGFGQIFLLSQVTP